MIELFQPQEEYRIMVDFVAGRATASGAIIPVQGSKASEDKSRASQRKNEACAAIPR